LVSEPHAYYTVARRMARSLGYKVGDGKGAALSGVQRGVRDAPVPQVASASEPATRTYAPFQRRSVRPVAIGGAPVESAATTLERRLAGAKSSGAMLELMGEIGTPFASLLK
jgi:hypothetical protein